MRKHEIELHRMMLRDEGHVGEELEKQYKRALRVIEARLAVLMADGLTDSRVYRANYQKVLHGYITAALDDLKNTQYETVEKQLRGAYIDSFVGTAYTLAKQGVPVIMPIDQNQMVKAVLLDSKINKGLYEALGADVEKLKKTISAEISRGIASSMTQGEIARNIANQARIPLSRANTIVATESHRIQESSAHDARVAAKRRGCDVVKQWSAILDDRTRDTHRRLDGQIREIDEPFEIDGKKAMYPGGFGRPEEDINCRCVALTRARWAMDKKELAVLRERAKHFGLDKSKDFADFKRKYLDAAGGDER